MPAREHPFLDNLPVLLLLSLFTRIILPIFVLMAIGALFSRWVSIDLQTINRLTFYILAPAVVILKLAETELDPALLGAAAGFSILHMALLLVIGWPLFGLPAFRARRPELVMSLIFYNSGNYGLPLAQLAFGDLGVNVMAILMSVQLVMNFTLGLWLVGAENGNRVALLRSMLRVPLIYILPLSLLINTLNWQIPPLLRLPLQYLADGLIPMALLALGVQLVRSRAHGSWTWLSTMVSSRLIVAPLTGLGLAALWALLLPGSYGQVERIVPVLVVGAGLPVAVNAYILCAEYGRDAELASQSIFWTTLLSAFTLTGWLLVVQ